MVNGVKKTKELVMEAIRRLRIERGFTASEIMHYIESNHDVKVLDLRRGVFAALKRGADYGLFKAQRGGRYALGMAPTVPQLAAVKRKDESEDEVNERGCAKKRRKSRRRCCTKMWVPRRTRRRTRGCKKRTRRSKRKSGCKRRRKRTRKNRCAKSRRRSSSRKKRSSCKRRSRPRRRRAKCHC